jgi:ABC-type nickel/cobalt efflux system permease component RcnA
MVILGLLLVIAAIVAAIAAALRGDVSVHVDLGWFTLDANAGAVFFLGAAAMLVFVVGWWMVARGFRRSRQRHREVKTLRRRAAKSEDAARREHDARVAEQHDADSVDSARHRDDIADVSTTAPDDR